MSSSFFPEPLSSRKQEKYKKLVTEADSIFLIGWLRDRLREPGQIRGDQERLFAEALCRPYPNILSEMKGLLDNPFRELNVFEELEDLRAGLIWDFVQMKIGSTWYLVKEEDDESWRAFVHRVPFVDELRRDEIEKFFQTLYQICMITDILAGHASEHGLAVDETLRKEHEALRKMKNSQPMSSGNGMNPDTVDDYEMVELKFFDMRDFDSAEKQLALSKVLRSVAQKIDRNNGRDWLTVYVAYRYAKKENGVQGKYVDFFSDIESLIPDMLYVKDKSAKGDARYKNYTKALGQEVRNWYVENMCLPPINSLVYSLYRFGCHEKRFLKLKPIISELYKWLKDNI